MKGFIGVTNPNGIFHSAATELSNVSSKTPSQLIRVAKRAASFKLGHSRIATSSFLLITSRCLVCGKVLLEGRLRKPDRTETSVGVQYVLARDKYTPAPKDIPDEALREFYDREWEFRTTLLADFNKLTIAVAVAAAVFFDKYPSVFYAFIVTCFIMIALYAAAYLGQRDISKKYYRDAGKSLTPTYKSSFDVASKYLQAIFGVAIIVVLCVMIRAERMTRQGGNNDLEKTRPYNPPTRTQDTRPYNPPKIEPEKQVQPPPPPPPPEKKK